MITVSDDGRGIDCERIRHKIVAKGLVGKAEARELTDRDLIAYIWHPGLSTAETITEISGRGVGMDIVKSRIENLNGAVNVRSVLGQGTTFIIRLPLTLAIMSSLLVRIFDEIYAIPLDHIDEIVEVRPDRIYRVQGRPAIEIRKKIVALVSLGDVFQWGGQPHPSARRRRPPGGRGRLGQADRRRRPERRDHDRPGGRPVDRHAGSGAQVAGEELPVDPRTVRGQHPGRWPRLADPRSRHGHRHGRQAAGPPPRMNDRHAIDEPGAIHDNEATQGFPDVKD